MRTSNRPALAAASRTFCTAAGAALFALGTVAAGAQAQEPVNTADLDDDAKIARAMEAAPASVAAEATIVDVDGRTLREGSNGWTCLPEVVPGYGYPVCADDVWLALIEALRAQREPSVERLGVSYMLAGDAPVNNADPADTTRDEGEPWVEEGPHVMLAVPDPGMLEGIPTDPDAGGPYVMWAGTPYAHVMVPTAPR